MLRGDILTITLTEQASQTHQIFGPVTATVKVISAQQVLVGIGDRNVWLKYAEMLREDGGGAVASPVGTAPRYGAVGVQGRLPLPPTGDGDALAEYADLLDEPTVRVALTLTPWIAGQKGLPTQVEATVLRNTVKAICVTIDGVETWIPKSQIAFLQRADAVVTASEDSEGSGEDLPDVPCTHYPSWGHQKKGWHFAKDKSAVMYAVGMGGGKSKMTVDLIVNRGHKLTCIFCPPSVVKVWPKEIAEHAGKPVTVLALGKGIPATKKIKRAQAAVLAAQRDGLPLVIVTNYQALQSDPFLEWVLNAGAECVVADEIHKIKSATGVMSKAMASIGKITPWRIGLTGTPMPHSPLDIFGQYRFLDPAIFGENYSRFRAYFAEIVSIGGVPIVKGYKNHAELNERFLRIAYQVGREVLDLPPATHTMRFCTLTPGERRIYDDLEESFYTWIDEGNEVTAGNVLTRMLRMQQVTSGFVKNDLEIVSVVNRAKEALLTDVLDDLALDEPVIVFGKFKHDLAVVRRVCMEQGRRYAELSGDADELELWQNGGADVIGVNIRAGEAGIDLTRAHYCVYFSICHSLGDYDQSLARPHRPGQKHEVTYVHLLVEDSIDEKIYKALRSRREVVDAILDWHNRHAVISLEDPDPIDPFTDQ